MWLRLRVISLLSGELQIGTEPFVAVRGADPGGGDPDWNLQTPGLLFNYYIINDIYI